MTTFVFEEAPADKMPLTVDDVPKDNPLRKKNASKSTSKPKAAAPSVAQAKKLCEPLPDLYRMMAVGLFPVSPGIATELMERADDLGNSWLKVAETSPKFRQFLARMNQASGWGAVAMAHLPIAIMAAKELAPATFGIKEDADEEAGV